jgi:molybdopterin molybdotransferase
MRPGAIYNSNRFFLRQLLARCGCDVTDLGIVPDQREATVAALRDAAGAHDLILTSGGVSVGEEDHVKPAVQQLGSLDLWQIAMKPGKPFAHGMVGAAHFIGLPGNPVSSFVTFLLLVRPFLLQLQGATALQPPRDATARAFRLETARQAPRVPARAPRCVRRARVVPQPELGRAHLHGVGRRPGRRARRPHHLAGDPVRFLSLAELLA